MDDECFIDLQTSNGSGDGKDKAEPCNDCSTVQKKRTISHEINDTCILFQLRNLLFYHSSSPCGTKSLHTIINS